MRNDHHFLFHDSAPHMYIEAMEVNFHTLIELDEDDWWSSHSDHHHHHLLGRSPSNYWFL